MSEWLAKPMHERSFRVALTGYVHDDDHTIIADMQQRIEHLEKALAALVGAFRNPGDGGVFEPGEVPELDRARALLANPPRCPNCGRAGCDFYCR